MKTPVQTIMRLSKTYLLEFAKIVLNPSIDAIVSIKRPVQTVILSSKTCSIGFTKWVVINPSTKGIINVEPRVQNKDLRR